MQARGEYDCAVYGDGPHGLFTAYLLVQNGERVVVIREPRTHANSLRFMPGFDSKGVIHYFLNRWGMKKIPQLESPSKSLYAMNVMSVNSVASLQGDLKRKQMGGLLYESSTTKVRKLVECLSELEKSESSIVRFMDDFSGSLLKSQEKYKKYLPHLPIDVRWKRSLKRTLKNVTPLSQKKKAQSTEVASAYFSRERMLFEGVHGLFRLGRTHGKGTAPSLGSHSVLGSALELFILRRAPFVLDQGEVFCAELRRILESKGVQFVNTADRVNFKQDGSGDWDAFFSVHGSTDLAHLRFSNFIMAHDLQRDTLKYFDDKSKKRLESEFLPNGALRVEYDFSVDAAFLPEQQTGDAVFSDEGFSPLFFSLTVVEKTVHVSLKADIATRTSSEMESILLRPEVLKQRLIRKIREIFPSLSDARFKDDRFHSERVFEFSPARGVSTRVSGVWTSNRLSYPEMGAFSPVLSSIELARRFAKKRKRELVL